MITALLVVCPLVILFISAAVVISYRRSNWYEKRNDVPGSGFMMLAAQLGFEDCLEGTPARVFKEDDGHSDRLLILLQEVYLEGRVRAQRGEIGWLSEEFQVCLRKKGIEEKAHQFARELRKKWESEENRGLGELLVTEFYRRAPLIC